MKSIYITFLIITFSLIPQNQIYSQSYTDLDNDLNAVYFIRGTPKELIKAGYLKRRGGRLFGWLFGLKCNEKYTPDLKNDFMKIHRLQTTVISGGLKKVKKIYPKQRGYNSYIIRGNQLIITDPIVFWESYKFVIISHK